MATDPRGVRPRQERAKTINYRQFGKKRHLHVVPANDDYPRPRTRGDCGSVPRPCPFVSCRWNLYLDVMDNGSLKLNFPDLEPDQMDTRFSCALDVADRGGSKLETVGYAMNIVRERVRQVEAAALRELGHFTVDPRSDE